MKRHRLVSRTSAVEPRGPGRPRSATAHDAILTAAIALVREVGYDNVTMDAIALRAGVGKATVYRRWTGKETLVAEGIERIIAALPTPDTGTIEGDLRGVMRSELALYADPATRGLLHGLVAAIGRSDLIARAVREGFVATRRASIRRVLERGIARGELRADADVELAMDVLAGPLFLREMFTGGPVNERVGRTLIAVALHGLGS